MPTVSGHLRDEIHERAKAIAERDYRGKMGTFVAEAVEEALARKEGTVLPDPPNPVCLVELTRLFAPAYEGEMAAECARLNLDQPKTLAALLQLLALGKSGLTDAFIAKNLSKDREPTPIERLAAEDPARYKGK